LFEILDTKKKNKSSEQNQLSHLFEQHDCSAFKLCIWFYAIERTKLYWV